MGKRYDAERVSAAIDDLGSDLEQYKTKAKALEAGFGRYYHNEAYRGKAAEASKEFIAQGQMDKLHVENLDIQRELYRRCLETDEVFKEMVDSSPVARIDTDVLLHLKKDHQIFSDNIDVTGYELECKARELMDKFGEYSDFYPISYHRARNAYDELSGSGGHYDKCLERVERFDDYAKSYINNSGLKERTYDLQNKIVNMTGALQSIQVFSPSVAKNSLTLAALWNGAINGSANILVFANDKERAEYLDTQLKRLCDGDDSNDAEATANINACLNGFLCVKEVNGKKYVAYDQQKIRNTLNNLEVCGLGYQLLTSIDNQIEENKANRVAVPEAITKLGFGGKLENTKLEVSKYGAGVKLEVTSNNDLFPLNEIDHKLVSYAATKASSDHYFCNKDGSLNWDNITEWIKMDSIDETSYEYDVFSAKMMDMSDEDIEKLLNLGMVANTDNMPKIVEWTSDYYGSKKYIESQNIQITARRYAEIMNVARNREGYNYLSLSERAYIDDNETRSIAFLEATQAMSDGGGLNMVADITTEGTDGEKVYKVQINVIPGSGSNITEGEVLVDSYETFDKTRNITVYPRASADVIDKYLDDQAKIQMGHDVKFIYSHNLKDVDYEKIVMQTLDVASEYAPEPVQICMKGVDVISLGKEMAQDYKNSVEASTAMKGLDTGNGAICMGVEGSVVYNVSGTSGSVIINDIEYNETELKLRSGAYDIATGADVTPDELKEHYVNGDDDYHKYYDWYYNPNRSEQMETYRDAVRYSLANKGISLENATDIQLNEAMKQVSEAIKETNSYELRNVDKQEIKNWIQENGT
ncbi:hypothetical protein [Butyrivibrio sp. M55]|uniref:hypothetical protein n=1 Tax=Butyrivibrio sp. M55 TaxID=1855323 RepID=UPI0008EFA666|nr:hypothetical protein [Butyrivibrio sp. M55]SFU87689.1 hypothetical protein SAMN05216540_11618 [Butyrivibrio sp. M55]